MFLWTRRWGSWAVSGNVGKRDGGMWEIIWINNSVMWKGSRVRGLVLKSMLIEVGCGRLPGYHCKGLEVDL